MTLHSLVSYFLQLHSSQTISTPNGLWLQNNNNNNNNPKNCVYLLKEPTEIHTVITYDCLSKKFSKNRRRLFLKMDWLHRQENRLLMRIHVLMAMNIARVPIETNDKRELMTIIRNRSWNHNTELSKVVSLVCVYAQTMAGEGSGVSLISPIWIRPNVTFSEHAISKWVRMQSDQYRISTWTNSHFFLQK